MTRCSNKAKITLLYSNSYKGQQVEEKIKQWSDSEWLLLLWRGHLWLRLLACSFIWMNTCMHAQSNLYNI